MCTRSRRDSEGSPESGGWSARGHENESNPADPYMTVLACFNGLRDSATTHRRGGGPEHSGPLRGKAQAGPALDRNIETGLLSRDRHLALTVVRR